MAPLLLVAHFIERYPVILKERRLSQAIGFSVLFSVVIRS
jgi:hypothetical protein